MKCNSCGDELEGEEIESPKEDREGNVVCDNCFENRYTHRCPVCEELFDENFTEEISPKYIVITSEISDRVGVLSGIYEIIEYPFFADGMIEWHFFECAIKWLCAAPSLEYDTECYICDGCAKSLVGYAYTTHAMRWIDDHHPETEPDFGR